MKHLHWYKFPEIKCQICHMMPWEDKDKTLFVQSQNEKRKKRSCLNGKAPGCAKQIFGFKNDRLCNACDVLLKRGNLI